MKHIPLAGCSHRVFGCILALFAGLSFTRAQVEKPTGVFSASGATNTAIYDNSALRGVLIRADWSMIEATDDVFNFTFITNQVAAAKAAGKSWSLAVAAGGPGSPAWLTDTGGKAVPYFTYDFHGTSTKLPLFWNSTALAELAELAAALGAEFNSDADLKLVYVSQMTANGIEGHLNGIDQTAFTSAGYTATNWINASEATAVAFADAFPDKALAFEVHELFGDETVPETIINDLWNDAALEQRVGAGMWWISGGTTYQPDLVTVLTDFEGDVYGQVIGKSYDGAWTASTSYPAMTFRMPTSPPSTNRYRYQVLIAGTSGTSEPTWPTTVNATVSDGSVVWICRPSRFDGGDYTSVFDQAMTIGMRYIEPWEDEFKDTSSGGVAPEWDSTLAAFNAWADEVFLAPDAPTGLTATGGVAEVSLDWDDNSESDLAGYLVYRATTTGGPYTEITASMLTSSDYNDSAVSGGTTYYYTVTAVDDYANESDYSSEDSATPTVASTTVTFSPTADSYVNESSKSHNYGSSSTLNAWNASKDRQSYLKFTVSGVSGTVTNATLKLKCKATNSGNTSVHQVTDTSWSEGGLTWNNKPAMGTAVDSAANVEADAWIELDVTSLISGNGTYSIGVQSTASSLFQYYSRETSGTTSDPVLEVTY
jgi:hypothetical protein